MVSINRMRPSVCVVPTRACALAEIPATLMGNFIRAGFGGINYHSSRPNPQYLTQANQRGGKL